MFTALEVHCVSPAALMAVMQPEMHKCWLVDRTSTGNYGLVTLPSAVRENEEALF
jgi:hypothetical protein